MSAIHRESGKCSNDSMVKWWISSSVQISCSLLPCMISLSPRPGCAGSHQWKSGYWRVSGLWISSWTRWLLYVVPPISIGCLFSQVYNLQQSSWHLTAYTVSVCARDLDPWCWSIFGILCFGILRPPRCCFCKYVSHSFPMKNTRYMSQRNYLSCIKTTQHNSGSSSQLKIFTCQHPNLKAKKA